MVALKETEHLSVNGNIRTWLCSASAFWEHITLRDTKMDRRQIWAWDIRLLQKYVQIKAICDNTLLRSTKNSNELTREGNRLWVKFLRWLHGGGTFEPDHERQLTRKKFLIPLFWAPLAPLLDSYCASSCVRSSAQAGNSLPLSPPTPTHYYSRILLWLQDWTWSPCYHSNFAFIWASF